MKRSIIILGGELNNSKESLCLTDDDFIICADKGYDYALSLNITPNIVIGDFDSANNKPPKNAIIMPQQKDDTDGMLCALKSIELGFTNTVLIAALGGRIDHILGNIQILSYLCDNNVNAKILDNSCEIYITSNSLHCNCKCNQTVSIVSLSEISTVTSQGLYYPLNQLDLYSNIPRGISNVTTSDYFKLEVAKGKILIAIMNI